MEKIEAKDAELLHMILLAQKPVAAKAVSGNRVIRFLRVTIFDGSGTAIPRQCLIDRDRGNIEKEVKLVCDIERAYRQRKSAEA